jgi:hypothetical protein
MTVQHRRRRSQSHNMMAPEVVQLGIALHQAPTSKLDCWLARTLWLLEDTRVGDQGLAVAVGYTGTEVLPWMCAYPRRC